MKKLRVILCACLVIAGLSKTAFALSSSELFDYGFGIDGTTYWDPKPGYTTTTTGIFTPSLPGVVNTSGFNFSTGLGTITATITGAGSHSFLALFNHDINGDGDYSNETGAINSGTAASGQSWQIGDASGTIYSNFIANTLSATIDDNTGGGLDLMMAMGWNFTLSTGQTATLTFGVQNQDPWNFELLQYDPNLDETLHFGGDLTINGGGSNVVPEPSTFMLVGTALAGLAFYAGRTRKRTQ